MDLNRLKVAFIIILLIVVYKFFYSQPISHPSGILIPTAPIQTSVTAGHKGFKYKDYFVEPLAQYQISARILSIENYWLDPQSDIAPVDWALGWKEMSDSYVLDQLKINQSNRFYFYRWNSSGAPVAPEVMKTTSANVHILPSDPVIAKFVKEARVGDLVDLKGYLVRVHKKDGSEITSSLTREDSGAGSCEVMWVTQLRYR